MANNTCANCAQALKSNGSPIEDPLNSAGAGQANRFCTPRCRDIFIQRAAANKAGQVMQGLDA